MLILIFFAWFSFVILMTASKPKPYEITAAINAWLINQEYVLLSNKEMRTFDMIVYGISALQDARRITVNDKNNNKKFFLFIFGSPLFGIFRPLIRIVELGQEG